MPTVKVTKMTKIICSAQLTINVVTNYRRMKLPCECQLNTGVIMTYVCTCICVCT